MRTGQLAPNAVVMTPYSPHQDQDSGNRNESDPRAFHKLRDDDDENRKGRGNCPDTINDHAVPGMCTASSLPMCDHSCLRERKGKKRAYRK